MSSSLEVENGTSEDFSLNQRKKSPIESSPEDETTPRAQAVFVSRV